jgi:hypothetical protein
MKYNALKSFLASHQQARVPMSFEQVAAAAGTKLPASAYRHPAWWANDATHHVQAKAWLEAGYQTEQVDVAAQRVVFVRTAARSGGVREMPEEFAHHGEPSAARFPLLGWMKGTFTIAPGVDLTAPALDAEEWAEWEASLDRKADLYLKGPSSEPE